MAEFRQLYSGPGNTDPTARWRAQQAQELEAKALFFLLQTYNHLLKMELADGIEPPAC